MIDLRDLIPYKKNCCFAIPYDRFTKLCKDVYGKTSKVTFDSDGIIVIAEDGTYRDEADMMRDFTDALKINIESIHITNTDENVYVISTASF